MTGNAFLKRLSFQLDFLNEEDQKTVLGFYEKKLKLAATLTEEEAIVKTFGSPERIAEKLRESYLRYQMEMANSAMQTTPAAEEGTQSASETTETAVDDPSQPEEKETVSEAQEESIESTSDKALEKDEVPLVVSSAEEEKPEEPVANEEAEEPTVLEPEIVEPQVVEPQILESAMEEESEPPKEAESEPEVLEESDEDVIFSKPINQSKAPEIIHSLENSEVVSLYGEKVVVEDSENEHSFEPDPIDLANGMTEEEIEHAKAETLEKAESYNTASFGVEEIQRCSEKEEESDSEDRQEGEDTEDTEALHPDVIQSFPDDERDEEEKEEGEPPSNGLFTRFFHKMNKGTRIALTVLCSLLLSPIILVAFGVGITVYAVAVVLLSAMALLLFLLLAGFVVLGVVEIVYGIVTLFQSVSIALIELGLGTIFFAIVAAIAGLIYECLFALVPKAFKAITRLVVKYVKMVYAFLYGGAA